MTTKEAINYIENFGWSKTRLGLGRTRILLEKIGNPHKGLKFIHVAGSNGKGSTCAMLEAILRKCGYKTGLYISPYIQNFCERIQVDGENIGEEDLARITETVKNAAETMDDHPSQFEMVTAIAFEYFKEQACDIIVLEVGMGGELDSTNVIDAPELACITNIGLEHTEYLGNTLEEIAKTKAGIIKTGCSCVCYDATAEVTEVIKNICRDRKVPLKCVDFSRLTKIEKDSFQIQNSRNATQLSENDENCRLLNISNEKNESVIFGRDAKIEINYEQDKIIKRLLGQSFLWRSDATIKEEQIDATYYELGLIGTHQLHNAALVLTGIELLREKGWKISDEAIKSGLKNVKWPARFEVLSREPIVILDGGHNPQCARAMAESIAEIFPGQKVTFLTGVLREKNYDEITDILIPYAKEFICVTPVSKRALSGEELKEFIVKKGVNASSCETIEDGILTALERTTNNNIIVIFGSLYLAGEARTIFNNTYRKWLEMKK